MFPILNKIVRTLQIMYNAVAIIGCIVLIVSIIDDIKKKQSEGILYKIIAIVVLAGLGIWLN